MDHPRPTSAVDRGCKGSNQTNKALNFLTILLFMSNLCFMLSMKKRFIISRSGKSFITSGSGLNKSWIQDRLVTSSLLCANMRRHKIDQSPRGHVKVL